MKYYSPSTLGFYDDEIHGNKKPTDCISLTNQEYEILIHENSNGLEIAYENNRVIARKRLPTEDEILADKIETAKAYLNSTDWRFARLAETGEPVPQDVLDKRAEARAFIRANEVI